MEYDADDVLEQRLLAYEQEVRAKYKQQSEIDEMGKKGEAFGPDDDGHYSYPIGDEADLKSAIKAVGRGNATHDKIRKFIIGRAKALKATDEIPDNWNSDGSIKDDESKSRSSRSVEWRRKRALELRGSERRARLERVEVRENSDGTLHLTGYASVTDTPYDMGWYTESVARGAFKKTLAENPDVQLLINHAGLPLARTLSGTLQLSEDNIGLKVDADLDPEDPDVQSLTRKMQRGDIDQMSFAFRTIRQSWNEDYTDRSLTELDLHRGDVSVVNQGANPYTSTSVRSEDAALALRHVGPIGVMEALLELRSYSALPKEVRAGKAISSATGEVLLQILNLCAIADDAMDEAQPVLAELLGVDNPDDEDAYSSTRDDTECPSCGGMNDSEASYCDQCGGEMSPAGDTTSPSGTLALPDYGMEARARLEALRHGPRKDVA